MYPCHFNPVEHISPEPCEITGSSINLLRRDLFASLGPFNSHLKKIEKTEKVWVEEKETKVITRAKKQRENMKLNGSGGTKVVMYKKGEYNSRKISHVYPIHLPSILGTPSTAQERRKGSILPQCFVFLASVLYLVFSVW